MFFFLRQYHRSNSFIICALSARETVNQFSIHFCHFSWYSVQITSLWFTLNERKKIWYRPLFCFCCSSSWCKVRRLTLTPLYLSNKAIISSYLKSAWEHWPTIGSTMVRYKVHNNTLKSMDNWQESSKRDCINHPLHCGLFHWPIRTIIVKLLLSVVIVANDSYFEELLVLSFAKSEFQKVFLHKTYKKVQVFPALMNHCRLTIR